MLDPVTGADKTVTVAWESALQLRALKSRPRPCGYWLRRERGRCGRSSCALLGVEVERLEELGELRGETYREIGRERSAAPRTLRGALSDAGGVDPREGADRAGAARHSTRAATTSPSTSRSPTSIVAALEPDRRTSFVANGIVTVRRPAQARMLQRPDARDDAGAVSRSRRGAGV